RCERYVARPTICAETGAVMSCMSQATSSTGNIFQLPTASPKPASASNKPSTWGFVAACIRDSTSGNRSRPKPATADNDVPTTNSIAATRSNQESKVMLIGHHLPSVAVSVRVLSDWLEHLQR